MWDLQNGMQRIHFCFESRHLKNDFCVCVVCVCTCTRVYAHVCDVCGVCACVCTQVASPCTGTWSLVEVRGESWVSWSIQLYSLETGSLRESRARLVKSKPQLPTRLYKTHLPQHRKVLQTQEWLNLPFYVGCGDLNSSSHASTVIVLTRNPCSHPERDLYNYIGLSSV